MLSIALAAVVLFADAAPAAAQAAPATQVQPAAPPAPTAKGMTVSAKTNDYVCHREEVINTRISKRVCRSRQETEAERGEVRQFVEHLQAETPVLLGK